MKKYEEILLGGMFRPTEQNCPTREGELIESLDKIYDIPNPRVGMRVYVENTGKEYIVRSLKEKTIGGVTVPDAMVDVFEEAVNRKVVHEELDKTLKYTNTDFKHLEDAVELECWDSDHEEHYVASIFTATPEHAGVMSAEDKKKLDAADNGATKIVWDALSNMNDFKTPGVYDIYGERTRQDDNLPILNASSGHSIAARLTVVASTLQPANNEICVTQFLQLSNRVGGDGATYVRTYNEKNNSMNGWSAWQKQMGMIETLINSNDTTVGQEVFSGSAQKIGDGLNGMIDNGMYSGIYIDNLSYTGTGSRYYLSALPTFVETFVLVVINDYAASGQAGLPRHITQLKYAVDAITGQSTVKKRVGTGNDAISWSDWEDIGGGGSQEVDITDAVKAYGLPTLVAQGLAKEGVGYVIKFLNSDLNNSTLKLDSQNKLSNFFKDKYSNSPGGGYIKFNYKVLKGEPDYNTRIIDGVFYSDSYKYNFYIVYSNTSERIIQISQDMTTL